MSARTDSRLERLLGRVLLFGVTTSSVFLGVGLALSFVSGWSHLAGVLLTSGLIVLMATPVARVVVSAAQYLVARDWVFVALTTTVLVELLASLVAALYGRRL